MNCGYYNFNGEIGIRINRVRTIRALNGGGIEIQECLVPMTEKIDKRKEVSSIGMQHPILCKRVEKEWIGTRKTKLEPSNFGDLALRISHSSRTLWTGLPFVFPFQITISYYKNYVCEFEIECWSLTDKILIWYLKTGKGHISFCQNSQNGVMVNQRNRISSQWR